MPDPAYPDAPDDRLSAITSRIDGENPPAAPDSDAIAILSCPDDTGVALNLGRPGARFGPAAFRAALTVYGTAHDARYHRTRLPLPAVFDAGDAFPNPLPDPEADPTPDERAMLERHAQAQGLAGRLQEAGYITIAIGGGNDFTLPCVTAMSEATGGEGVAGMNVDPHLDVRERPGSGMPYRKLIEAGAIDPGGFTTAALGRFTNNADHLSYLTDRGGAYILAEDLRSGAGADQLDVAFDKLEAAHASFLSIDLDSIDAAYAPGVSARNPAGLTPGLAASLAERAGRTRSVRHFELMELAPPHDDPPFDPANPKTAGRTARLAAHLVRHFVAGVAERQING